MDSEKTGFIELNWMWKIKDKIMFRTVKILTNEHPKTSIIKKVCSLLKAENKWLDENYKLNIPNDNLLAPAAPERIK